MKPFCCLTRFLKAFCVFRPYGIHWPGSLIFWLLICRDLGNLMQGMTYSLSTRMADFVMKVLGHFEIDTTHILGPDIGSPVSLLMAARHPMKIKSAVISGGASTYPLMVDNALRDIINAPDLEGFKQIPVKDIINNSLSELKNYVLPEEIREGYISSYSDGRLFKAMQILRVYITDIPLLDKLIEGIKTPVQIIWGEKDPIVPVEMPGYYTGVCKKIN